MLKKYILSGIFIAGALTFIVTAGNMSGGLRDNNAEQAKAKAVAQAKAAAAKPAKPQETAKLVKLNSNDPVVIGHQMFKRKCLGCHTAGKGDPNRTGPNLWNIIDRPKAAAPKFRYSKAMKRFGGVWSESELNHFIAGPKVMIRDTKMTYRGLKTEQDRLNIIAYLKTLKD